MSADPPSKPTPADGTPLPTARQLTSFEAMHHAVNDLSRRALRFGVSFMIFKLQLAGKLTPEAAIALTACALGVESAIVAWREKKLPAAAGLTVLPLLLAGLGSLAPQAVFMDAAGYAAALIAPLASYVTRPAAG